MQGPRILLVSQRASRVQHYSALLEQLGVACQLLSAVRDVPGLAAELPLNGILLDMPVIAKASPKEKADIEDVLRALPSAYVNIMPASGAVRLLTVNGLQGTAPNLEMFVELCSHFIPRLVLPKDRCPLFLNALLSTGVHQDAWLRTATLNVSPGGCFLFCTEPEIQLQQSVQVRFVGIEDDRPISAVACWLRRWGAEGHHMPGIGVRFQMITEQQQGLINGLLAGVQ